jgi:hypothetical protein
MKKYFTSVLVFLALSIVLPAYAQDEEPAPEEETQTTEPQETGSKETGSDAGSSFVDDIFDNVRNPFGFSLTINEGYSKNSFANVNLSSKSSRTSSYSGKVFANLGRKKSRLHINYGAGYRRYGWQQNLDGFEQYGNITYSYQPTRRISFRLSDTGRNTVNDVFDTNESILATSTQWTPNPSYDVIFNAQRYTQNNAEGDVDFQLTRSTEVGLYGSYNIYRYDDQVVGNVDTVQVGAGLRQRITKWLYISSNYSTYLNDVNQRYRDHMIHRIEAGGLQFRLGWNLRLDASGGFEIADMRSYYHTAGTFRGSLTRSSQSNTVYANYQRALTTAIGFSDVYQSDIVTIGMGQRIWERFGIQVSGSYYRSEGLTYSGLLKSYRGRAQLQYSLRSNLFASINYGYQHQKSTAAALRGIPYFNRSMITGSLQYAWPSRRLR